MIFCIRRVYFGMCSAIAWLTPHFAVHCLSTGDGDYICFTYWFRMWVFICAALLLPCPRHCKILTPTVMVDFQCHILSAYVTNTPLNCNHTFYLGALLQLSKRKSTMLWQSNLLTCTCVSHWYVEMLSGCYTSTCAHAIKLLPASFVRFFTCMVLLPLPFH